MYSFTEYEIQRLLEANTNNNSIRNLIESFVDTNDTNLFELLEAASLLLNEDLTLLIREQLITTNTVISFEYYTQLWNLLAIAIEKDLIAAKLSRTIFGKLFNRFLVSDLLCLTNDFVEMQQAKFLTDIYRYICTQSTLVVLLEELFLTRDLPDPNIRKQIRLISYDCYRLYDSKETTFNAVVNNLRVMRKSKKMVIRYVSDNQNTSPFYIFEQHQRLYEQMQSYLHTDNHSFKSARKA